MNFVAAALYAMSSSVLVALVLALFQGGQSPKIAGLSLAAGMLVAAFTFWRDRFREPERRKLNGWEWAVIVFFALFVLRAFLWLVFADGDEIKVLSPNNLGDLSLHLTYIHQMANGVPFWPDNPIVAGSKLTYPLGTDLFNSLLTLVGVDPLRGLIWVGLAGCAMLGVALWHWGKTVAGSRGGAAFTLAGFLCNGGLAGMVFLKSGELLDYQSELAWKSLPLALLVTQRGLLFALPAGLLLLSSWRTRFFKADSDGWKLPFWGEVLLYASMPIFHLHTFLFLSIVLLAWFLFLRKLRLPLAKFVAISFIPASCLVFLVTGNLRGPSVISWHFGWMQNDPDFLAMCQRLFDTESRWITVPFFWFLNFGILPFFVVGLIEQITRTSGKRWARSMVFPALAVFLLCCVVRFAPWEWDNTKLMIWSYVAILPFLWREILVRWPVWLRAVGCFGLFWSGFISLLGGLDSTHQGFAIATRSEIDLLAPALHDISPTERFVAHPNYNHPLLLLGRPLVLGYPGHVWSHGYSDWQKRQVKVEGILNGEENWLNDALDSGAHYLFWGAQEREAYPNSPQPWREQLQLVANGEWGEIYDLRKHRTPTPQTTDARGNSDVSAAGVTN